MQKNMATRSDRRQATRYAFNGLVPAKIILPDQVELEAVYIDVSRGGLGILCSSIPIAIGDEVELRIEGEKSIPLEVCWVRIPLRDLGTELPPMLRLGLRSHGEEVDLIQCFDALSCLDR